MGWNKGLMASAAVGALLAVGYVSAGALRAQAAGSPTVAKAQRVDDFRLPDHRFGSLQLYRLADAKAVVIVTQANGCASVRDNAPALKALQRVYAGQGVEFMMLNSSLKDSREAVAAEAKVLGVDMPILLDANQLVGEQLGVARAGEVFVLNPKTWQVVYRGPVDPQVASAALDPLIAGEPVSPVQKAAAGCAVEFPMRSRKVDLAKISYAKQVAPILEQKCIACHQAGGIGPMALTSYEQVKAFSPMMRETLRTERMPPYHADPSVVALHDAKNLSPQEIKTLVHWIEAGSPRGEGIDPLGSVKHEAPEWPLGKPDLVLDIPAYTVPATGVVDYQRPWVENPLSEGRWLRASTIKPGSRQAVHHVLTGYMTEAPKVGEQASESRWGASVGGYAVGAESLVAPDNVGTFIPAGGAIGFQNHYSPFGKEVTDRSQIALYFYPKDKAPEMVMHNGVVVDNTIAIPAGAEHHEEKAYLTFPKEALLFSAFPHAHYRGASSKLEIQYPDGSKKLVLAMPYYDFNWQRDYEFAQPIKIPAGSKLIATYIYDNSKRNPANPNPKDTVYWGEQSFQEMLYTAIRYRWTDETSAKPVAYDQQLMESRMVGMLDENLDGKVEMAELKGAIGNQLRAVFATLDKDKDGGLDAAELNAAQGAQRGRRASQ
jgi:hypothetical protein